MCLVTIFMFLFATASELLGVQEAVVPCTMPGTRMVLRKFSVDEYRL